MSGQENLAGSEVPKGRTFSDIHREFENVVTYFSAGAGSDRRFNLFARTQAVFDLGIIAGVNETLWKAYIFGPAHDVLNRPENVVQYTTLLLRLKALYEKYRSGKRINVGNIIGNLDDIVIDLIDFSREIMKQSRCEQPQNH